MSDEDEDEGEEERVGYKRPPKRHQFKKGVSGNPRGRPKTQKRAAPPPNSVRVAERIWRESRRLVPVKEGGQSFELPLIDAVLRAASVKAMQGSPKDQIAFANLVEKAEQTLEAAWRDRVEGVLEYQQTWREIFEQHDRRGQARPDAVPHPDEIQIDFKSGQIVYNGPADDAEQAIWSRQKAWRDEAVEEIDYIRQNCAANSVSLRKFEDVLSMHKATIVIHDGMFPSEELRRKPRFNIHEWRRENGVSAKLDREGRKAFREPWDDKAWVRLRPTLGVKLRPYKADD